MLQTLAQRMVLRPFACAMRLELADALQRPNGPADDGIADRLVNGVTKRLIDADRC